MGYDYKTEFSFSLVLCLINARSGKGRDIAEEKIISEFDKEINTTNKQKQAMEKLKKLQNFKIWKSILDIDIQREFSKIEYRQLEPHSFTFFTSVSVMSSLKIEGEQMELDSYVKYKMLNIEYLPELTQKPDDLYKAYLFAKKIS